MRKHLISAPFAKLVALRGKKVIVTGAATGSIGFETARTLAAWGATVIVTTRADPAAIVNALQARLAPSTGHGTIEGHVLDLSQAASVSEFVAWYTAKHGQQLDILVNNAGIHLDLLSQWKTPRLSDDGHEIHWRTNYLGTVHLTQLLMPLLQKSGRASGDARIVNVVSQLHGKGSNAGLFAPAEPYNSWVAYGTSKLALVHATLELQRRFARRDHVQAYCLHPGAVFTNIASKGLSGNPLIETTRRMIAPIERFFLLTPEEGAQTQIHCATQPGLTGGLYYRRCQPAPTCADAQDAAVSARLWGKTMDWVSGLD